MNNLANFRSHKVTPWMAHIFERSKHYFLEVGFEDEQVAFLDCDMITRLRSIRTIILITQMAEQKQSNTTTVIGVAVGLALEHIVNKREVSDTLTQKVRHLAAIVSTHDVFYDIVGRDVYNVLQQRTLSVGGEKANRVETDDCSK